LSPLLSSVGKFVSSFHSTINFLCIQQC